MEDVGNCSTIAECLVFLLLKISFNHHQGNTGVLCNVVIAYLGFVWLNFFSTF